jgi:hypothetical protein
MGQHQHDIDELTRMERKVPEAGQTGGIGSSKRADQGILKAPSARQQILARRQQSHIGPLSCRSSQPFSIAYRSPALNSLPFAFNSNRKGALMRSI